MAGSNSPDAKPMSLTLKVWRQKNRNTEGKIVEYKVKDISTEMSFLEMLDVLNEDLLRAGEEPVAFDHDCREGICGSCNLFINGRAHGPEKGTTTCQLHMRKFSDGDTITVEPWRANSFPVNKDLSVDRSAFDRIIQAGGYVSINTGGVPDANEIPIPKSVADMALRRLPALAAAPAWRPARTPRPCCSCRPRCRSSRCCRKGRWSAKPALRTWWPRWIRKASAPAPTSAPARPSAPWVFRWKILPA